MSFLDEIKKQPRHIREVMFALSVVITISLVGMIWFRSFEEDLFVLLNTDSESQEGFYAERSQRTPTVYATIGTIIGELRATIYNSLGFLEEYNSEITVEGGEEYTGGAKELPLSGNKR